MKSIRKLIELFAWFETAMDRRKACKKAPRVAVRMALNGNRV